MIEGHVPLLGMSPFMAQVPHEYDRTESVYFFRIPIKIQRDKIFRSAVNSAAEVGIDLVPAGDRAVDYPTHALVDGNSGKAAVWIGIVLRKIRPIRKNVMINHLNPFLERIADYQLSPEFPNGYALPGSL